MKHSSRRSTVSRAPDFHRPTGTACCPESFRRLVLSRSQLAKQSRPCALTSAFLGIDVEAHLRRHILTLGLLCFPLCNLLAQSANAIPPIATLAELRTRINEHLGQSRFASALWGVKIVSLDSGKALFEHNAGKLFEPASNAKLFTGALALDRLGPDYRIKTAVYAAARPDSSRNL